MVNHLESLRVAYSDKRHVAASIFVAVAVGIAYFFLTGFLQNGSISPLIGIDDWIFLAVVVALTAVVAGLQIFSFRQKMADFKKTGAGMGGAFIGLFSAACPACQTLLLSALGLGGFLTSLPLQGQELRIAAVGLLAVSFHLSAKAVGKCDKCVPRLEKQKL